MGPQEARGNEFHESGRAGVAVRAAPGGPAVTVSPSPPRHVRPGRPPRRRNGRRAATCFSQQAEHRWHRRQGRRGRDIDVGPHARPPLDSALQNHTRLRRHAGAVRRVRAPRGTRLGRRTHELGQQTVRAGQAVDLQTRRQQLQFGTEIPEVGDGNRADPALRGGENQILLGRPAPVDGRFAHLGPGRHRVHRDRVHTLLRNQGERRVEHDPRSPLPRLAAPPTLLRLDLPSTHDHETRGRPPAEAHEVGTVRQRKFDGRALPPLSALPWRFAPPCVPSEGSRPPGQRSRRPARATARYSASFSRARDISTEVTPARAGLATTNAALPKRPPHPRLDVALGQFL